MNYYYANNGEFSNQYKLRYAPANIQMGKGWERITRSQAIILANAEKLRRRDDPAFSGYSDSVILPYDIRETENPEDPARFTIENCIAYRI